MHEYKYGYTGPESSYYYGSYDVSDHLQRLEFERRNWEYATPMMNEMPETSGSQFLEEPVEESVEEQGTEEQEQLQAPTEEC